MNSGITGYVPRPPAPPIPPVKRKRRWVIFVVIGLILLLLGVGLYDLFGVDRLKGRARGRTNIMLYGMTADGKRTDAMVLASYYWTEGKLVLLNIPRDLYASYDGRDTKIVSLYAYAQADRPYDSDYPAEHVNSFIEREYGITVDYWAVANMNAFKELVDSVGGVTVNVERSFTDNLYPLDDYSGYMVPGPHFDAGVQTMSGTRALIFARSRHASGIEGTDFARSKRQQLLIQALLSKLRQQGVLTDVAKVGTYFKILKNNFRTNLDLGTIAQFLQATAGQIDPVKDVVMANWNNNIGFLCDSTDASGAYVLRYGVPSDCTTIAGTDSDSPYRLRAVKYVQELLQSATSAAK